MTINQRVIVAEVSAKAEKGRMIWKGEGTYSISSMESQERQLEGRGKHPVSNFYRCMRQGRDYSTPVVVIGGQGGKWLDLVIRQISKTVVSSWWSAMGELSVKEREREKL